MSKWFIRVWIFISLCVLGQALPAGERYDFDKIHTQILFFVDHLGFSKSQGEFHDYAGMFAFDPNDWNDAEVDIRIRTASIDMDNQRWDDRLRGKDFFAVDQYPEMRFRSLKVERTGERDGRIHGEFSLLGVTRPLSVDFHFNKAAIHPLSRQFVAGFSARTSLRRSDFGMKYGLGIIGDEVEIRLEVEGIRREQGMLAE